MDRKPSTGTSASPTGEFDENSEVILALKLTTSGSTAAGSASRR